MLRVITVVVLMICYIVFARFPGGRTSHKQIAVTKRHIEQLAFWLIRLLRNQPGRLQILYAEHELLVTVAYDSRRSGLSVK